jgi:hypothetical protein
MILLCGIPSEAPLAMVGRALNELGAPYVVFNQRQFATTHVRFELADGRMAGWLELDGQGYPLSEIMGVYTRLMDHRVLPEVHDLPPDAPLCRQNDAVHNVLAHWCEIAPTRVVNRVAAMGSNSAKPYQAQLIRRQGFAVPETLVTNDPELVLAFNRRHSRIIYKSISGVRSVVKTLGDRDLDRLAHIRWCPTQFSGIHRRRRCAGPCRE